MTGFPLALLLSVKIQTIIYDVLTDVFLMYFTINI